SVGIGASADRAFAIQNTGGGTLTGSAATAAPFSIVSGGSFSLAAGATQLLVVRFKIAIPWCTEGSVALGSNGGELSLAFTGTGVPPPVLSISPSTQYFGSVGIGASADFSFTIQNTGDGTLTGSASTAAPFSIVSGGSFNLAAGATQLLVVRF